MEAGGTEAEQVDAASAKAFWMEVDVDQAFDELCEYVAHLRSAIKDCTATDREYVQGMNLITSLDSGLCVTPTGAAPNDSFVKVVIGGEVVSVPDPEALSPLTPLPPQPSSTPPSPLLFDGSADPLSPSYVSGEDSATAPPTPASSAHPHLHRRQRHQPHDCGRACVPNLPPSAHYFRWHNPLKVPLHCGFQRYDAATPPGAEPGPGGEEGEEPAHAEGADTDSAADGAAESSRVVAYEAPCGKVLRTPAEALGFLFATASHGVLRADFFSFDGRVRLDCPRPPSLRPLPTAPAERDLSRGAEPTPVELLVGEGGAWPEDFRYRKERWPHGCFLSRGAAMFRVCCDCADGCLDRESCACIRMTSRGQHYSYHRLNEPVPAGLYECGPWCGCERARCQNRVVQRGLRVRLQVFQTDDKGWGVRCRDDLDRGTFVCTYAGVVLRACLDPDQPTPSKRPRAELPSDDEVEVVTEWLAPVGKGRGCVEPQGPVPPGSPPLHVPVIQRPAADPLQPDPDPLLLDTKVKRVVVGSPDPACSPTDTEVEGGEEEKQEAQTQLSTEPITREEDMSEANRETSPKTARPERKPNPTEHMYYLDATKDGNVGRFLNHHCEPNLFVQNVFTDSHDPNFPMVAFFTNKVVKAGTELTWNYSHDPGSSPDQEVPCLCGSDACQGRMV